MKNIDDAEVNGSFGLPIDEMHKAFEQENARTDYGVTEDKLAFEIPDKGFVEIFERDDEGYDYTLYDSEMNETDGGVYDDGSISIRQALANILEDIDVDIDRCVQINYDELYSKAEEKSSQQSEKNTEPYEPKIGDKFRDTSGAVWELTSLTGALPWYTDQCAITSANGTVSITMNESYTNLLDTSKYERIADAPETSGSQSSGKGRLFSCNR